MLERRYGDGRGNPEQDLGQPVVLPLRSRAGDSPRRARRGGGKNGKIKERKGNEREREEGQERIWYGRREKGEGRGVEMEGER